MPSWQENYAVGHDGLDEQHKGLVSLSQRLVELSLQHDAGSLGRSSFVNAALDYIALSAHHFAYEETVMAQMKYPHLTEHKVEHSSCTERLLAEIDLLVGGGSNPADFAKFIEKWVCHHLSEADAVYRQLLGSYAGSPLAQGLNIL